MALEVLDSDSIKHSVAKPPRSRRMPGCAVYGLITTQSISALPIVMVPTTRWQCEAGKSASLVGSSLDVFCKDSRLHHHFSHNTLSSLMPS